MFGTWYENILHPGAEPSEQFLRRLFACFLMKQSLKIIAKDVTTSWTVVILKQRTIFALVEFTVPKMFF